MQARIAATGLIAGAVQGDDTQDSQPPHVDLMPCTFHSPSPRRASDWGMMEFCKRYGHSQDHGMARQTSGQQIPPKGTTRQKISKTSPSKREIHGFLTDRITRFPCQNMKLCKLGVQVGAYLEDRAPNTPKRGDRTGAARPLSRAKVSRGQDLPRAARPLSRAKVSPGGETRPGLPTHFRMRKSPGGKTCPGLPAHFRMRKAPGGQDQSCRLTFACESLPRGFNLPVS